ncbi:hypothetical protein PHAMO_40023 [Magnetospirillum molischianum DSM 120]|uniref:Uncharacterized protein n=1 Tax=Magnetospirillum molischianum DSM 120 TaxID=1150626 RepID=H8FVS4_MAGML|nr:hypothetical protein PHAMO_40023 [Magnetospirillum molischianum DSM 120]
MQELCARAVAGQITSYLLSVQREVKQCGRHTEFVIDGKAKPWFGGKLADSGGRILRFFGLVCHFDRMVPSAKPAIVDILTVDF